MDLSTVLGVALAAVRRHRDLSGCDSKQPLIDPTSFLGVGGMYRTIAAFLLRSEAAAKVLMKTVFWKSVDVQQVIDQAIELNTISRRVE